MNTTASIFLLRALLLGATGSLAQGQTAATWMNWSGDHQWENSANWEPKGVPNNNTFDVFLSENGPAQLSSSFTIRSLTLPGAAAKLQLLDSSSLQLPHGRFLANDGVIELFGGRSESNTRLRFAGDGIIRGAGTIVLDGVTPDSAAIVTQSSIRTLQHASGHTIRGRGGIDARFGILVNEGTILADEANSTLRLALSTSAANTHVGLFEARDGGLLHFSQGVIDLSGGGIVSAAGMGSRVQLGSPAGLRADLRGATFRTSDGGFIMPVQSDCQSCTNEGAIAFGDPSGQLLVSGTGLRNNGTILISDADGLPGGRLYFHNPSTGAPLTLDGTGVIHLDGSDIARASIWASDNTIHAAPHRIRGRGRIPVGTLRNNSSITSDVNGGTIELQAYIYNNATIEAKNGGSIIFDTHVSSDSRGTIVANGAGSTVTIAPRNHGYITRQDLIAIDGGVFNVYYPNFDDCTLTGTLQGFTSGSIEVHTGGLTNNGRLILLSGFGSTSISFHSAGSLRGNGTIELRTSLLSFGAYETFHFAHPPQHTIAGTGSITPRSLGTFVNEGTLAPGGQLIIGGYGKVSFAASSRALFAIGGLEPITQHSVLSITNLEQPQVTLDGTIAVSLRDDFTPTPVDTFEIINSTTRPLIGTFRNAAEGGRVNTTDGLGSFRVNYTSHQVLLSDFGPPVALPLVEISNVERTAEGEFVLAGRAPAGATVYIRAAGTPGGTFEQIGSVTVAKDGQFQWRDTAAVSLTSRFYRVQLAQ